jgi:hypothetical protein
MKNKKIIPIIKDVKANTYINAFILSAILSSFITLVAVSLKEYLKNKESQIYIFFDKLFPGKGLTEIDILVILFGITFLSAFLAYLLMYILFGYGSSMVSSNNKINFY